MTFLTKVLDQELVDNLVGLGSEKAFNRNSGKSKRGKKQIFQAFAPVRPLEEVTRGFP